MNTARKGRRSEAKCIALLRAAGYLVMRGAASKCYGAPVDLVAWNTTSIRFCSIKAGERNYASAVEREQLKLMAVPPHATKEIWRLPDGCREPLIEIVG